MNKMMSVILMVTGLYSFSTMNIPTGIYMALWCACIVMVRVSTDVNRG